MHRAFVGLLLVVAAVGLLGGASATETQAASPAAVQASTLTWTNCTPQGFQCATLTVPIDYSNPAGGTLKLALKRLPARNPGQRIGSLLGNPGGPGGSALDFLSGWAPGLSADIRNRFDLVAFDPRGVGQSTPIDCHATLQQFVAVDPTPDTPAEWTLAEQAAKTFVDGCEQKYASLLPFLGTKNVARDMESVRVALGEAKLTYVGYSYGTAIGAVYADMYPKNVRAFVLDGALDLSQTFEQSSETQMVGFERAYQAYLADCRAKACALAANGDPGAAVDALLAKVETSPLPAPQEDRKAGPGETLLGIISAMYSSSEWPFLTSALVQAINGNGSSMVELADSYLQRNSDGSYPNLIEANMAVNYDDAVCPKDPLTYRALADQFAKASPHFGASAASSGLTCAYWPTTPDPLTAPKATGAPPIVVISTTNDPATPYEWGVAMSKQLESGHLIIHRGEGHTIYAQGDSCIDGAVNAYLVNLTVPATGLTCGTGAPPPDNLGSPTPAGSATPATPAPTATSATSSATNTAKAPGPPHVGDAGKSGGSGRVGLIALGFVLLAGLGAAGVVALQRRA